MDEDDERIEELTSMEAIFPEMVRNGPYAVSLEIPVPLTKPVRVVFPAVQQIARPPVSLHDTLSSQQVVSPNNEDKKEVYHLWNLPSLMVSVDLPVNYPSEEPPGVTLKASEKWIPEARLDDLGKAATTMWNEYGRGQVLYSYIEHLQEAAGNCFDLADDGTLDVSPDLKVALLDHDSKIKKDKFDKETFDCMMCLEPKKGVACHRLVDCGHVFCVSCLQDFYNSCITEGDVDNVKCINPACGKAANVTRQTTKKKCLQPSELLQIPLAEETVQRYVKIRRKRKLEANPNTIYCPRTWCQEPARVGDDPSSNDSDSEEEEENGQPATATPVEDGGSTDGESEAQGPAAPPPGERLAVCTSCSFAFCLVCKRTWHGEFGWCSIRSQGELSREERATEDYLKKHSTPCPTCNARSQKIMGCNHMKCRQCNSHFCYLCSSWLSADNPYKHFNTPGTPCYQKLWELEEGDGAGAPPRPEAPPIEVIFEEDPPPRAEPVNAQAPRAARAPRHVAPVRGNARAQNIPPPAPAPPQQQANGARARPRAQQGPARAEPVAPAMPGQGLQRFLELAARDEEEDWDSDELDDLEEEFIQFALRE